MQAEGIIPRLLGDQVISLLSPNYKAGNVAIDSRVRISPNCVFDASLVPETCLESPSLPVCFLDSIRQAKAEIRHGASCPTISMAPVLAITSLVARTAL